MGQSEDALIKLEFDRRLHLDGRGTHIASNTGLLACRQLDEVLASLWVLERQDIW